MSDEPIPANPNGPAVGVNIPDAVEKLLADMEALKARVATLETKVP